MRACTCVRLCVCTCAAVERTAKKLKSLTGQWPERIVRMAGSVEGSSHDIGGFTCAPCGSRILTLATVFLALEEIILGWLVILGRSRTWMAGYS